MLNSAIMGVAAALVLAAKNEGTSYLNVNEEAFLVQKTGFTQLTEAEDVFFGLSARDNGLTAVYLSGEGWIETKVKANVNNAEVSWEFRPTDGTIIIN